MATTTPRQQYSMGATGIWTPNVTLKGASSGGVATQPDTTVTSNGTKVTPSVTTNQTTPKPTGSTIGSTIATPTSGTSNAPTSSTSSPITGTDYKSGDQFGDQNSIIENARSSEEAQRQLAEYYNKHLGTNLDTSNLPKNADEAIQLFDKNQQEEKSKLEKEAAEAKARYLQQNQQAQSATAASMSQGQNGVVGSANTMSKDQINLSYETQYNSQLRDLQDRIAQIKQTLQDNQGKMLAGQEQNLRAQMKSTIDSMAALEKQNSEKRKDSMDILKTIKEAGGMDNLSPDGLKMLQDGAEGVPRDLVALMARGAQAKATEDKAKTQMANLSAFADLAGKGLQIPTATLFDMAMKTGLPPEALFQYNTIAQQVADDKTLTLEQKQATLANAKQDLFDKQNGLTTEAAKKIDYLNKMRASGASPDDIAAFKSMAGITDYNDPITAAKLKLDQANATIKSVEAKYAGKTPPEGTKEYYDYLKAKAEAGLAQTEIDQIGGVPSYGTLDDQSAKDIFNFSGKSRVTPSFGDGKRQCGEAYNDLTDGPKVGDTYASKMAIVDKRANPQVGNALVLPLTYKGKLTNGHIETVIASDGDNITTVSYNRDGKGTKTIEHYTVGQLQQKYGDNWGFSNSRLKPEYAKELPKIETVSTGTYDKTVKTLMSANPTMSLKEAKSIALEQTKKEINKPASEVKAEKEAKQQEEFDKASNANDLLGMMKNTRGGQALDQSQIASLNKARIVKKQLDTLGSMFDDQKPEAFGVDMTPIWGALNSNNPWATKEQAIKAQLKAIVPNLARGIYGEVGVLTNDDVDNYMKTLPNLTNTDDVKRAVTKMTQDIIRDSVKTQFDTLARSGKDVSNFIPVAKELGVEEVTPSNGSSNGGFLGFLGIKEQPKFVSPYLSKKSIDNDSLGDGTESDLYAIPEDNPADDYTQHTF